MSSLGLARWAVSCVLLLGVAAGATPAAAATPDPSDAAAEQSEGAPAEAVAITYLGEATISAAPPWVVAGCSFDPLPDVAVVCTADDGVKLTASAYDAGWGEHPFTVLLDGPLGRLEADYRVTLAPPEPPAVEPRAFGYPVASGAQTLVPLSLLGITCTLCSPDGGAEIEVAGFEPATAGFASVTGAHLALRIRPGFTGDVVLPVRVRDDAGQTAEFEFTFRVSPAPTQPFGALHVVVQAPDAGEPLVIDLAALTWPNPSEPGTRYRCAEPVRGTVACADGVATYLGPPLDDGDSPVLDQLPALDQFPVLDQFAVQIVAPDGRQALASVTVAPRGFGPDETLGLDVEAAGAGALLVAPAGGTTKAVLRVGALIPDDGEQGSVSPLAPIAELLERTRTGNGG
jgi:hypothetical protein